ncbi:protein DA1-like isoform X1 [Apium graveolens]|uniref:protein DA1-like isoform X1 n=1 Tax=Apium graveolens TaxID=4045 RepID=UPI003D79E0C5
MEYNGGYINGRYGAFAFEDPLSEDENEDIHHALEHSILESKIAEMNFGESYHTEEDEHHTGSIQSSIEDFEESYQTEEDEHHTGSIQSSIEDFAESYQTDEDERHTGSIQSSIEDSDESMRQRKASMTPKKKWWRKLFSSLNIFEKSKQYDAITLASSTSERDSNFETDQVCDVCDKAILSDQLTRTYWGQKVCHKHLSDGSTMCCSCSRFKIGNMRYIRLSDGRRLCSDCHCTAIMDTEASIPLIHEVFRFLKGINMKILEDFSIFLVDKKEYKRIDSELGGKNNPGYRPSGMTTYTAGFVVRSVARSYQRGDKIYVKEEVHKIQRKNKVTSMLIVYGFPRLAMGATLAHEMMHAWMRIQGYSRGIPLEVEEGICEVMAHRWLDWYTFVGEDFLHTSPEQVQFLRNLKEVLKNNIEKRCSKDVYGHGFREAKWAIERYGLKLTMSHVARTGKFPQ